jgi:hypothetical protein
MVSGNHCSALKIGDVVRAWEDYLRTGLHVTGAEVEIWLEQLEQGKDVEPPECHI